MAATDQEAKLLAVNAVFEVLGIYPRGSNTVTEASRPEDIRTAFDTTILNPNTQAVQNVITATIAQL